MRKNIMRYISLVLIFLVFISSISNATNIPKRIMQDGYGYNDKDLYYSTDVNSFNNEQYKYTVTMRDKLLNVIEVDTINLSIENIKSIEEVKEFDCAHITIPNEYLYEEVKEENQRNEEENEDKLNENENEENLNEDTDKYVEENNDIGNEADKERENENLTQESNETTKATEKIEVTEELEDKEETLEETNAEKVIVQKENYIDIASKYQTKINNIGYTRKTFDELYEDLKLVNKDGKIQIENKDDAKTIISRKVTRSLDDELTFDKFNVKEEVKILVCYEGLSLPYDGEYLPEYKESKGTFVVEIDTILDVSAKECNIDYDNTEIRSFVKLNFNDLYLKYAKEVNNSITKVSDISFNLTKNIEVKQLKEKVDNAFTIGNIFLIIKNVIKICLNMSIILIINFVIAISAVIFLKNKKGNIESVNNIEEKSDIASSNKSTNELNVGKSLIFENILLNKRYKMEFIKDSYDALLYDKEPRIIKVKIKEIDESGIEHTREDLLSKIEVYSKDNNVDKRYLGIEDGYMKLELSTSIINGEDSRAEVFFRCDDEGYLFTNSLIFNVVSENYIDFENSPICVINDKDETYEFKFDTISKKKELTLNYSSKENLNISLEKIDINSDENVEANEDVVEKDEYKESYILKYTHNVNEYEKDMPYYVHTINIVANDNDKKQIINQDINLIVCNEVLDVSLINQENIMKCNEDNFIEISLSKWNEETKELDFVIPNEISFKLENEELEIISEKTSENIDETCRCNKATYKLNVTSNDNANDIEKGKNRKLIIKAIYEGKEYTKTLDIII